MGQQGLVERGVSRREWTLGGVASRDRAPALWVAAIVGVSSIVRCAIGLGVPSPWILPDEVVYSELAKSIAAGGFPSVRGVPELGWGVVYPMLIAPAWAMFHDPFWAYRAALVINAVVMSLAAVPAYLLARMFVSSRASLLVAAMTVLVPSMAYTGVVMTENAFYPVFLLSLWLIARAVRRPTLGSQVLALLALGVVVLTRIQGLALVGAYTTAVLLYGLLGPRGERGAYLRRFAPSLWAALAAMLAPVGASLVRGDGALGWLGARSGTFDGFHALEVPEWFTYLTADLLVYVAIIPGVATALVLGSGLSTRAPEKLRLFASLGLSVFLAMLTSVSLVSASLDVDGRENLNERYVFYVVPLMFVGLALWIGERLPKPRPWALIAVATSGALVVLLPIDRLELNANFQSLALMPWLGVPLSATPLHVVVAIFAGVCGVVWWTCRQATVGRLWLVAAVTMMLAFASAYVSEADSASFAAAVFDKRSATWLDSAVPTGATVAVVWDERHGRGQTLDPFYPWIMVTEFFNESVRDVYRLGPPTYYEDFLPTIPVALGSDGTVLLNGRPLQRRLVLVTCQTPVSGAVLARAPRGSLELVQVEGPVRLSGATRCAGRWSPYRAPAGEAAATRSE